MSKTKKRNETDIRNHLAENLNLIEPGATLIDKEVLLHNDKGAKGFLDIFARTSNGKFLIVEVKRSDATAREAIQELVKYVALLRQNLLVKKSEIRLMIASTDWHELLVPFSEFVRATPYDCRGLRLHLGADGLTQSVELVDLAPEERPRKINRRHFIWGFKNEDDARSAIPKIATHMQSVGLNDFVILLIAISTPGNEDYRFLYFAQQELSLETYLALISNRFSIEELEEFQEWLEDFSEEEDKIGEAADKVWDGGLYHQLKPIDSQIAYPEKARKWFAPETLVSSEVFRFGRFNDDHITDEVIVAEIQGDDGASYHHGSISAELSSKTELAELLNVADNLFDRNPVWRTGVHDLCDYAKRNSAKSVKLSAFSNDDILMTVAGITIGRPEYVPSFMLEIRYAAEAEQVFGTIEWSGRKPNFASLVKDYFEGDRFQYFMHRHFGTQRNLNADLMAEMGLTYGLGRLGPSGPIAVRVQFSKIEDIKGGDHIYLEAFVRENPEFTSELTEMFLDHDLSFQKLFSEAAFSFMEHQLEAATNVVDRAKGRYWAGDINKCDVCGRDMSKARFMIDSAVIPKGPWGCMCAECFGPEDGRIAWGSGQLYERDEFGWRLVGGGAPSDDEDELV